MKILFITSNRIGDAVLTTGVLAWLERHYPSATFTIACGPHGADLFRAVPRLERLLIMKKRKANGHWLSLWARCIGTRWDLIVDFRNSLVSRLLYAKKRAILSHHTGAHKVIDNASVLKLVPPPDPHIWLSDDALKKAETLVPSNRPVLALGPAANWPLKQWPVDSFVALMKALTGPDGPLPDAPVMVFADRHERPTIEPLVEAIPENRRIILIGHDLQTVAACLKKARLYIGNDSGLMHLAAALHVPTLGLFGPGFPDIYGPWKGVSITTPESRDALLKKAATQTPPPKTLMQSLSVERVLAAAQDLLKKTA
ncbi:MAG: glycosyltransferase family 9 protein [Alphaproteobacteria bacterium]|nr:glycosyltransferase family 9 protein [Alphaproteobacteria bacterium]